MTAVAQQEELDLFVADMLKVADDFGTPGAEVASYQSGGGWFSSAKDMELWEVDFSVHGNVLFVPEGRKTTTVASSDYTTFDIRGAETAEIPTAFGTTTDVVFEGEIEFTNPITGGNEVVPFDFDAIDGIDKKLLVHPFVQASVGLPYGTDLSVRFLPETTVDEMGVSTYGLGLKHNFNQYFSNSQPTDFQFAGLLAYSKFDVNYEYTPVVIEMVAELNSIEVDANFWLFQLISSKSFFNSNWEVFGAVGVTSSDFGYTVGGSGFALGQINDALQTLNNNELVLKGDLGFNYCWNDFMISSMFSAGKFLNYNLGLHYRL